jgi:hypothetical protein
MIGDAGRWVCKNSGSVVVGGARRVPRERNGVVRRWRVWINLELLRRNLSSEDRTEYDTAHVARWLRDSGFTPGEAETLWLVADERDLGQLQPEEVTGLELEPEPEPETKRNEPGRAP